MGFFSPNEIIHELAFTLVAPSPPRRFTRRRTQPIIHHHTTTTVQLPLEIVLSIIETAALDDEHVLKHCSLVCRSWSLHAQKLLFTSVTLRSETAFESFRRAINPHTQRGRLLGNAVTRLRAVIDHNQPFSLSQHSFAQAVTSCTNLSHLDLSLYGCAAPGDDVVGAPDVERLRRPAPSFDDHTLALLRSGPMISSLHFSNWSENHHSITQLLDVWPTLNSLSITGTPPQPPSPFLRPFPCALRELRMNFQSPPSLMFVEWLLHNSSDTLRVVEFEKEPSGQLLQLLTASHGSSLQSLSFPSCHITDHVTAVQKCRDLKELRLEHPAILSKLWRNIPDSLQHISLGVDLNTALQPVIDMVRKSDALRAVTVNLSNGGDQHTLLSVLKMACAFRGVDLRIVNDLKMFRSQSRAVPISSFVFPAARP